MSLLYLDASAIVKLVVREAETDALHAELDTWRELVSSIVSRVEVPRAVHRLLAAAPESEDLIDAVFDGIALLDVDAMLARDAAGLAPAALRSLDAIHLASAMSLGSDLGAIATYDLRLAGAARKAGIPVVSPT